MHAISRSGLLIGVLTFVGMLVASLGSGRRSEQPHLSSSQGSSPESFVRHAQDSREMQTDPLPKESLNTLMRPWSYLHGDGVVEAVAALRPLLLGFNQCPGVPAEQPPPPDAAQAEHVRHARFTAQRRAFHLIQRHLLRRHGPLEPTEIGNISGAGGLDDVRSAKDANNGHGGVVLMELLCVKWFGVGMVGLQRDETDDCRNKSHACRWQDPTNAQCGAIEDWASQYCSWSNRSRNDDEANASSSGAIEDEDALRRMLHYHAVVNEVLPRTSMDGSCSDQDDPPLSSVSNDATTSPLERRSSTRVALSVLVDIDHAIAHVLQVAFHLLMPSQGLLCLVPKLRAIIVFARTHRWMFDANGSRRHHPLVVGSMDEVVDVQRDHHHLHDVDPTVGSSTDRNFKFGFHFNFHDKKAAGRSSARAKPIYFNLSNVIVSSTLQPTGRGGVQLSGIGVPGGYKKFDRLRDERFIPIRRLHVVERSAAAPPPRFVIRRKRPLYLFPVLFGSDNIGHVMFRYYSAVNLMSSSLGGGRLPRDAMIGYVVLPSAGSTFRPIANMHRAYYDAFGPSWFSLLPGETVGVPTPGPCPNRPLDGQPNSSMQGSAANPHRYGPSDNTSYPPVVDGTMDILFEHVVVGFGATYMFHPRHIANIDAERVQSQAALVPALRTTRNMLLQCFGWQRNISMFNATLGLPPAPQQSADPMALRVTLILRTSRQLENAEVLAAQLEDNMGNANLSSALRGRRMTIRKVRLEHLSIRDQVALAMSTDVLVGVAGSGLSWMMFMLPWSVVVEIQDPPIMRCTGVGINQERTYCDFSKQSAAANLHHIGIPATKANPQACATNALHCNLKLSYDAFAGTMAAALCSVGMADPAAAHSACSKYFPAI